MKTYTLPTDDPLCDLLCETRHASTPSHSLPPGFLARAAFGDPLILIGFTPPVFYPYGLLQVLKRLHALDRLGLLT